MEMAQSSFNLDEDDIELLIDEQLMKDIEAVMSGRRIDETTGELTTAPLGDEYIMQKLQSVKPEVSDEDDDDDDDDERDDFGLWPKNPQDRLAVKNFMRGCKTNPYPERGSIIKFKLSEGVEDVEMEGGKTQTLVVENHIQLDYDTGAWAHIKIHRNLHGMVVPIAQSMDKTRNRN